MGGSNCPLEVVMDLPTNLFSDVQKATGSFGERIGRSSFNLMSGSLNQFANDFERNCESRELINNLAPIAGWGALAFLAFKIYESYVNEQHD